MPTLRLPTPVIGQGSWQMERTDRKQAIGALRRGLDLSLTHIDTAEMYGDGAVETLVGEAIAGRRDEVFLASKVLPSNASYAGTLRACEQSLQRLGCDHLDLYMLHWPGNEPLTETFRAFEQLVSDGKILRYGVSNFDVAHLDEALAICGADKLACNQVLYHLLERGIEHGVLPWCQRHGVPVVAYSPFGSAGGFPTGEQARVLAAVAEKHGVSSYQVVLRFLAREEGVHPIPKAATVAHVEDNAAALNLALEAVDIAQLDAAYPRGNERGLAWI